MGEQVSMTSFECAQGLYTFRGPSWNAVVQKKVERSIACPCSAINRVSTRIVHFSRFLNIDNIAHIVSACWTGALCFTCDLYSTGDLYLVICTRLMHCTALVPCDVLVSRRFEVK